MNINDLLMNEEYRTRVRIVSGKRHLVGAKDFNGDFYYEVVENQRGNGKIIIETESEDEACRVLVGLK